MKDLNTIFLKTCTYTTVIVALFYLMAKITGINTPTISMGRYFLIFFFGAIIALVGFACQRLKINAVVNFFIHYSVLLTAFCLIFILSDVISGTSSVFVAITVFTLIYLFVWGVKRLITKKPAPASKSSKNKQNNDKPKSSYKPLYKD